MSSVDSVPRPKVSVVAAPTECCEMTLSLTSTATCRGGTSVSGGDTATLNEIMAPAAAITPLDASSFIACMAGTVCPIRGTEMAKCDCRTTPPTNRRGTSGLIWASDPAALKSQQKIDFASSRPRCPQDSRRYFDLVRAANLSRALLQLAPSKFVNNFIRPMTRLFYAARSPFERQPKDCSCMASLSVPREAPRPDFEPKVSGSGSQRVPLLTIMSDNGGAHAVLNTGEGTLCCGSA